MADKTTKLTIVYEVDTTKAVDGVRRLKAVVQEQKDAYEKTSNYTQQYLANEQKILALAKERDKIEAQLNAKRERAIAVLNRVNAEGRQLNVNLDLANANKSLAAYNRTLDQLEPRLKEVRATIAELYQTRAGAFTDLANRASFKDNKQFNGYTRQPNAPTFSFISGATRPKTYTTKQEIEEYTKFVEAKEKQLSQTVEREAERQKFYTTSSYNSRKVMYAGLFDEIAAKEANLTKVIEKAAKAQADFRGYTPLASGTVADNRAAVDAKRAAEAELVEQKLKATRAREENREEQYILYQYNRQKESAAREVQVQLDKQAQLEDLRNKELTDLRKYIQDKYALEAEITARKVQTGLDKDAQTENLRKQELAALRNDILTRHAAIQAQAEDEILVSKKLAETRAREDARENERIIFRHNQQKENLAKEVAVFQKAQQDRESILKYQVERQIAIEKYGLDSIQIARVAANNKARVLQEQLAAATASINARVSSGSISAKQGTEALVKVHGAYKTALLNSTKALNVQEAAHQTAIKTQKNLFVRIGEIIGIYKLYILVLQGVKSALLSIPSAGIQQQATQAAAYAIFGTAEGAKNLKFLQATALEAGQGLRVLEESYRRYASSAILAGAQQKEVNKSFREFAEVGTILHLPEDKLNSVFLALDQMYAKGVVQSEEIKKQLGNVLPGAVEIGAEAMKMTPAAFMDAMKKNQVIATEFVPKFAELYRKIFGGPDDSVFATVRERLFANLMRIKNSYENLARDIFAITQETLNNVVKLGTAALDTIRENVYGIIQVISAVAIVGSIKALQSAIVLLVGAFLPLKTITAAGVTYTTGLAAAFTRLGGILAAIATAINPVTVGITAAVAALSSLFFLGDDVEAKYTNLIGAEKSRVDELMKVYAAQGEGAQQAGEELEKIARLQDNSKRLLVEYKGEQIAFGSIAAAIWQNIENVMSSVFDVIAKGWDIAKKGINSFLEQLTKLHNFITSLYVSLYNTIKDFAADIIATIAGIGAAVSSVINDIENRNYEGIVNRAFTALKRNAAESEAETKKSIAETEQVVKGAVNSVTDLGKAALTTVGDVASSVRTKVLDDALAIQKEANKIRAESEPTIPKSNRTAEGITDLADKTGTKGANKLATAFYKGIEDATKNASKLIKAELDSYDRMYEYQAISIEDYFKTKEELQNKDFAQQIANYTKAKEYAEKTNNPVKIQEYSDKIVAAYDAIGTKQKELADSRLKEEFKFNDLLTKINAEYARLTGDTAGIQLANETEVNLAYRERLNFLVAQIESGRVVYTNEKKMLETLMKHEATMKSISDVKKKYQETTTQLSIIEDRIETARKAGFISESQAIAQIIEQRKEYIKVAEGQVEAIEKLAKANRDDTEAQLAAIDARKQLSAIKYSNVGQADSVLNSGQFNFQKEFEKTRQLNAAGRTQELDLLTEQYNQQIQEKGYKVGLEQLIAYNEERDKINSKYNKASTATYLNYFGGIAGMAAEASLSMTQAMQKMYGANSKEAKKAFMVHKAFALAQAAINTAQGFTQALAQGGIVGVITGAIVLAAGAAQIAQIAGQSMPAAHGGLTNVPKEQTYLLDKGERVLSPNQNKDLTSFINNGKNSNQSGSNIRIINAFDSSYVKDYMGSDEGTEVILNVVRKEQEFA